MSSTSKEKRGIYQPLDAENQEIRVLDLLPPQETTVVICRIGTVFLKSEANQPRPQFDALSYVWGESNENKTILVQGDSCYHELPVTDNLYAALSNMRRPLRVPMPIWVDSICINQSDDAEKSAQVALMSTIYRSATFVRVWLGEPTISHLDVSKQRVRDSWAEFSRSVNVLMQGYLAKSRLRGIDDQRSPRPHQWANEYILLESALASSKTHWTDRAWVVQEFCLARRVTLHFGAHELSYRDLSFLTDSEQHQMNLPKLLHLFNRTRDWSSSFDDLHHADLALPALTSATTSAKASDPKDKVYSLLGIMPEELARMIVPDYSFATWEVYAQATFASFVASKNYNMLELVNPGVERLPFLPTWVVDFSQPCSSYGHRQYRSSIPRISEDDIPSPSENTRVLKLRGTLFASVQAISKLTLLEKNKYTLPDERASTLIRFGKDTCSSVLH